MEREGERLADERWISAKSRLQGGWVGGARGKGGKGRRGKGEKGQSDEGENHTHLFIKIKSFPIQRFFSARPFFAVTFLLLRHHDLPKTPGGRGGGGQT